MKAMNMPAIGSMLVRGGLLASLLLGLALGHRWWIRYNTPPPKELKLQQTWELEPGDRIADYRIVGGLGDVSIALRGANVRAPFAGEASPNREGCLLFSSPEVPAYLFRYCGMDRMVLGDRPLGTSLGKAQYLQFATLRKQPDGSWAIVEPSKDILEKSLS
jgi:hypothetical protein